MLSKMHGLNSKIKNSFGKQIYFTINIPEDNEFNGN